MAELGDVEKWKEIIVDFFHYKLSSYLKYNFIIELKYIKKRIPKKSP